MEEIVCPLCFASVKPFKRLWPEPFEGFECTDCGGLFTLDNLVTWPQQVDGEDQRIEDMGIFGCD